MVYNVYGKSISIDDDLLDSYELAHFGNIPPKRAIDNEWIELALRSHYNIDKQNIQEISDSQITAYVNKLIQSEMAVFDISFHIHTSRARTTM